ncbi:myxosortase-dependent M36 family metallopeptidase [Myxococcus landrumensis]|uniref:Myxosortase-dependent M36 family metallopeptidase n=1 Tax=Myxococcus landrumensis TaxID=2813577 RepID=A0ABX7NGD0_9BACT|nr:myxosortase-dependent M36 family metallopeptidase [Myxococcus landrumus]QSQ16426.1 myxosortase-dependent M36 family metallopeptidase [Myxococcus landrumus]
MKRLWMGTVSAVLAVLMWSPQAQAREVAVDAFLRAPADRPLPSSAANASQRGLRINSVEGRLGVPTFVFREPALNAGSVAAKASRPVTKSSANQAAREHLRGVADLYRMGSTDVDGAELRQVHLPNDSRGAVIATYGRRVNGIEVFRSEVKVVMDASQQLVAIAGYLPPRQQDDEKNAMASAFRVSAPQAISKAFQDMTGAALDTRALAPAGTKGDYSSYQVDRSLLSTHGFGEAPRSKKILFPMPDGLVPAYYVEVNAGTAQNPEASYKAYVISARDGSMLLKHDLTESEQFTYNVWANPTTKVPYDGPQGDGPTPHPTGLPDGYQAPLNIPTNLVTLQNFPFSRNDPWLPANATETRGNNVDAYADLGGGDGFQEGIDFRASLTDAASRTFNYTYDVTKAPEASREQRDAAIVNIFYVTNFLHDWFYDAGFDEASGNAQMSNFGRGGLEGDGMRAEAQDYGGRNNANMSTPADGARPRMQQYIFDGPPELSSAIGSAAAQTHDVRSANFGPDEYDVSGDFAVPPTDPDPDKATALRLGCSNANGADPYGGAQVFAGKIAIIERGSCGFAYKTYNAMRAGAKGVIITNTATGEWALNMGASGVAAIDNAITVPALMVRKAVGDAWRTALANPDGVVKGKMRLDPDASRDGTIDNQIIAHEWGHYISNRLIGNASGLTNNQGRSMGEGWGDFTALLMTVRDEDRTRAGNDRFQGVYGMAGYTQSGGGNQGYYWGIRRVPYTTDMTKNALTLRHIQDGTPLPTIHEIASGHNGTSNAQVHSSGEVWATMLWECYASLLNAHPFQEAQDRMKRYLVAAYKATPSQPTFLEARDAVLSVAAASDPADYQRFLAAFAKRGAGLGARVPDRDSADHIGVVESFSAGKFLEIVSVTLDDSNVGCDKDGVLDAGETGVLRVTVRNLGSEALSSVTANLAFAGSSTGVEATFAGVSGPTSISFNNIARGATATATVPVQLNVAPTPASPAGALASLGVDVTFPGGVEVNGVARDVVRQFRTQVNYDEKMNSSAIDRSNTFNSAWVSSTSSFRALWENGASGTGYWHASNESIEQDKRLTSPLFNVAEGQNFELAFAHRFSFEASYSSTLGRYQYFDGGAIELSIDEGPWDNWFYYLTDAQALALLQQGVVNFVEDGTPGVGGLPGWVRLSSGFPNFIGYSVNFGTQFAGQQVRVRFRQGSDGGVGAYGWDVTNIQVRGITNATPFTSRVAESYTGTGTAPACNVRPLADAGNSVAYSEFVQEPGGPLVLRTITLDGSASSDPDGSALSYTWTQIGGPAVTLTDANTVRAKFSASVPATTIFTFQLVVNDGAEDSHPKIVQIQVNNVNRAPVALARVKDGGPTTVDERSGSITLDASGSTDADGEELEFAWTQTAGPAVELDDASSATPTFAVPDVTADTQFTFALVANDGIASSAKSTITITVRQVDRAPVADAGENRTVGSRTTVTLAGHAEDADGEAITYAWTQLEGTPVTLTGANTATPSFKAPDVTGASAVLRFSLVVTAGGKASAASLVTITVTRANRVPVVDAISTYTVHEGGGVKMIATAEDADGDEIKYRWTQVAGPSVTIQGADTAEAYIVAPNVSEKTVLLFRVRASDDLASSDAAEVAVTVVDMPKYGCSAAGGSASSVLMPALALLGLALRRRRRS